MVAREKEIGAVMYIIVLIIYTCMMFPVIVRIVIQLIDVYLSYENEQQWLTTNVLTKQ